MSIWDDRSPDWTSGPGLQAVWLFERAYQTHDEALAVAGQAGVILPDGERPSSLHDVWVWLFTAASEQGRALDLAVRLLGDVDRRWFHAPALQSLGQHSTDAKLRLAYLHGLPEDPADRKEVLAGLPAEAEGALQSINLPGRGLINLRQFSRVGLDACARLARIDRHGKAKGTGFLVGPDLVLTAAHVLSVGNWPPSLDGFEAVFDFVDQDRAAAESGVRVPITACLDGSPPTLDEQYGLGHQWDAPADRLDFALVRLERRVGDETGAGPAQGSRGYYELRRDPYDTRGASALIIPQHPLAMGQQISEVMLPLEMNPLQTRIRYRSNTLPGSSGSPVIDFSGRVVAIHHFSTAARNQAVPIWPIAARLADQGLLTWPPIPPAAEPAGGPQAGGLPFDTLQLGLRPFVNRTELRARLRNMVESFGEHTLVITGASDSGISKSYDFLAHVLARSSTGPAPVLIGSAPRGLVPIKVDLRKYASVALVRRRELIIADLCRQIDADVPERTLAQVAKEISTFGAWCAGKLRGSERQWWIFIDSVDLISELRQHAIDELLFVLIELTTDPQLNVRVVIAGREAPELEHNALLWSEPDRAEGLRRHDVAEWLRACVERGGRAVDPESLQAVLDELFPPGQPRLMDDLERAIAEAVKQVMV